MNINLGDIARDTVTGFQGMVTGYYTYLNGCVRLTLQPTKLDKDGQPVKEATFDVEQLELVTAAKARVVKPSGGPRDEPPRRSDPTR